MQNIQQKREGQLDLLFSRIFSIKNKQKIKLWQLNDLLV